METLATIGVRIRVTPWDDIWIVDGESVETVDDRTPFEFQVEGWLEDGQIFYGLYGPVVSGPERYHSLICNIILRSDGSDWRKTSRCSANFKVGPSIATRCHAYDFRHPDGTKILGYPRIVRFGEIRVVSTDGTDAGA
jgi:hypothetical protein